MREGLLLQILFTGSYGRFSQFRRRRLHRMLHRSGPIGEAQGRLKFQTFYYWAARTAEFGVKIGDPTIKEFFFLFLFFFCLTFIRAFLIGAVK